MTETKGTLLELIFKSIRPGHGVLIQVDGSITAYDTTRADKTYDFKALKDTIGCQYGELVYLSNEVIMVLDEEGKLTDKEINLFATALFQERFRINDAIMGDVVICHTTGIK